MPGSPRTGARPATLAPSCASSPSAERAAPSTTAPTTGTTALSHELRTPLNAILGNLGLLLDGSAGPLSSEARACLGDIQRGARQLLDRVQCLLDEVDRASPARADQPEDPTGGDDLVDGQGARRG